MKNKFYWITGSQTLYGKEILDTVHKNSNEIVKYLNQKLDNKIVFLDTVKNNEEIINAIKKVNFDDECAGIIVWMHTFSPAKMWINGLKRLQKPMLHFATQFTSEIPWNEIDMNFMNLNQSAHGDREFGFITSRMNIKREIIAGQYKDEECIKRINNFIKVCEVVKDSNNLKIARFGDNMRNVAVTEGDKIEAHIKLGWQVDYYGIGDLIDYIEKVTDEQIKNLVKNYKNEYDFDYSNDKNLFEKQLNYQAKLEIAIGNFLKEKNYHAFTTNFENLYNLEQLPGLACQNLMKQGYGFAGEGDWKTAGLVYLIKRLANNKFTSFMEDYTYNLGVNNDLVLGAHMLEVCPSIAKERPVIQVKELGIGGKSEPARLVFDSVAGKGVCLSLIDKRNNFALVSTEIETIDNHPKMPNLPVGKAVWKLKPNFKDAVEKWINIGGAHHTVLSLNLENDLLRMFTTFLDIEWNKIV